MRQVLATELSDRPVMGADGERLGTVHNVTMNPTTGELVSVVVTPEGDLHGFERTDAGRVRLPASSIQGLDDYLVVNPTRETWKGSEAES
jgi:sporulation protein YlmC with PRC-barrel domain